MKTILHTSRVLSLAFALMATLLIGSQTSLGEEAAKDVVWKSKWKWLVRASKNKTMPPISVMPSSTGIWEFTKEGTVTITTTKHGGNAAPPTIKTGTYSFAADGNTITITLPDHKQPMVGVLKISSGSLMVLTYSGSTKDEWMTEKWERTR